MSSRPPTGRWTWGPRADREAARSSRRARPTRWHAAPPASPASSCARCCERPPGARSSADLADDVLEPVAHLQHEADLVHGARPRAPGRPVIGLDIRKPLVVAEPVRLERDGNTDEQVDRFAILSPLGRVVGAVPHAGGKTGN